jgi:hypothetical protein
LVSSVPATSTTSLARRGERPDLGLPPDGRRHPVVTTRASRSSCATGTGCDQRVGSFGFDM